MTSSFSLRVAQVVLLLLGMSSISSAETITLKATATNTVQIKAFNSGGKTTYEIQLGGGNDQPPHDTVLTGKASVVIGAKTYSGYYSLSTAPAAQLRMISTAAGTPAGKHDVYSFVAGHAVLAFKFAPTDSLRDPWLIAEVTSVSATQQVPSQNNGNDKNGNGGAGKGQNGNGQNGDGDNGNGQGGNEHPPIAITGSMTAAMGGSLAASFAKADIQLTLKVGGNQRLLDLTPQNTHSGMSLQSGTLTGRYDPKQTPAVPERTTKEPSQVELAEQERSQREASERLAAKNEATAVAKLKLAKLYHDEAKYGLAQMKCAEIIDQFPQTKSAEEARRLLEKIKPK